LPHHLRAGNDATDDLVSKTCHLSENNSAKHWPILIISGRQHRKETCPPLLNTGATLLCEMPQSFGYLQQWIHTW